MSELSMSSSVRTAGLFWLLSGLVYLIAEAVSASAFAPTYSYAHNFISDLGVSGCGQEMQGRLICSPLHDVMNWAFMLEGAGFFIAAAIVARTQTGLMRWIFVVLAALHAIGILMVGIFHGSNAAVADGTGVYHVLGATLAIVCGNLAVLSAAGLPPWRGPILQGFTIILPLLGIVSLVGLIQAQMTGTIVVFDNGILERASVYSITVWQIVSGIYLMRRPKADVPA